MSAFIRRPDLAAFVRIECQACKGAARFHYRDEQGQRRWKLDHAAACSGRKGTTA